jgi:diguanylate cyclase (GGDEF)-like protein
MSHHTVLMQAPEDPTDSQVVRLNFRRSMRTTCTTFTVISSLFSILYGYLDSPMWVLQSVLTLVALSLRPLFRPELRFRSFLLATLALLVIAAGSIVGLWLALGVDALGHFLLFCITPMIVMSGRINIASKLLGVAALCVGVLAMDQFGGPPRVTFPNATVEHWALGVSRAVSLAVAGITAPLMLLQYFKLVCAQQAELLDMALRDPMTRLFNRRHAHEVGDTLMKLTQRDPRHRFSIVLLDLDHFKSINDRLGHDAGDAALKNVAATLTSVTRASDTSCRWGGEEFLILLPQTDEAAAAVFAERMRTAIAASTLVFSGQPIPMTASLGVSEAGAAESWESIVQRADEALYATASCRPAACRAGP